MHKMFPFLRAARVMLCALVVLVAVGCSGGTPPAHDELETAVHDAFAPLLDEYDVPGIAVAVTVDGQHRFFNFGIADKQRGTPVTQHTLFEIGSVSKTFTATLAGYALSSGALSLDEHPGQYLPALRGHPIDAATLRDLGTYTAGGLPLQFPDSVTDDASAEKFFQQWIPTAPPGTLREYSNPSIGLLGHVTALALHRDFTELLESTLFPGLGLANSFIRVPAQRTGDCAWGYNKDGQPIHVNPGVFDAQAYGVKTTSTDLIAFIDANIAPDHLESPLQQAIRATHVGYFSLPPMTQGLGWEQYDYPVSLDDLLAGNSTEVSMQPQPVQPAPEATQSRLFNKTGSTDGFGAYAVFVPDRRIGVIMLANRNFPNAARVTAAHAVLESLTR